MRAVLLITLLLGCGVPGEIDSWAPSWSIENVLTMADGRVLVFGRTPEYGVWMGRVQDGSIVDRQIVIPKGQLAAVGAGPDGTLRLALDGGSQFEIISSANGGKDWTYPEITEGTIGSFLPDGGFFYLDETSAGPRNPHRVFPDGLDVEYPLEREQGAALCGEFGVGSDGYEMHRIRLDPESPEITDRWEVTGRNQAFMPDGDQIVVSGLDGVYRLRAGSPEMEQLIENASPEFGAIVSLRVASDGTILYVNENEGRYDIITAEGTRHELPLQPPLTSPAGMHHESYLCTSDVIARVGDLLYVAQGNLAIIDLGDGSVRAVEATP